MLQIKPIGFRSQFNYSITPLSDIRQTLGELKAAYRIDPDGMIIVSANLDLSGRGLTHLPDLSSVVVHGSFYCYDNDLLSLKGAPQSVGGDFVCWSNRLVVLKHAPHSVGGIFNCRDNQLKNLADAPARFKALESDFGRFTEWQQVPMGIRLSKAI